MTDKEQLIICENSIAALADAVGDGRDPAGIEQEFNHLIKALFEQNQHALSTVAARARDLVTAHNDPMGAMRLLIDARALLTYRIHAMP